MAKEKECLIPVEDYMEVICAIHLSHHVDGPFAKRGGLMIVGPPAVMKTTMIETLENYSDAVVASNINMATFRAMVNEIAANKIRTLAFKDYRNVYAGDPRTASRVESTVMAMAEEGNTTVGMQDERMSRPVARAVIFGAMTIEFREKHFQEWEDSGFSRRFLWSLITLSDPTRLTRAIEEWRAIELGAVKTPGVPQQGIQMKFTETERKELIKMVRWQPGGDTGSQAYLLCRVAAALDWYYRKIRSKKVAMEVVARFGGSLGKNGARLVL